MKMHFWKALARLPAQLLDELLTFWKEDVWPLLLGFSFFFVLAIPLFIVLAVLWYLDSIQWKPEAGHYKIGLASSCSACAMSASLASPASVSLPASSASAAPPRSSRADIA